MIHQDPIFSLPLESISGHSFPCRLAWEPHWELAGRQVGGSCACLPARGADVEHHPDAQEELAQHRAQLGDQVELHDLTQVRVVGGSVCPELAKRQKHNVTLTARAK